MAGQVAVALRIVTPAGLGLRIKVLRVVLVPVTLVAVEAERSLSVVRQVLGVTLLVELGLQVCQLLSLALLFSAPVAVVVRARV
jgi:hypothetical protein